MSSIQRKLGLLLGAMLLALALAAPSAMAIEVSDPETEELCPSVSPALSPETEQEEFETFNDPPQYESGGCTMHMWSMDSTQFIRNGTHWGECNIAFDLHMGPDGWGYADNFAYTASGGAYDCNYSATKGNCNGTAVIAPSYVNPKFLGNGVFRAANGETDFNIWLCAAKQIEVLGAISLDMTQENNLHLRSQVKTPNSSWLFEDYIGGSWAGETGLLIS